MQSVAKDAGTDRVRAGVRLPSLTRMAAIHAWPATRPAGRGYVH
jgi:hypothetical protein